LIRVGIGAVARCRRVAVSHSGRSVPPSVWKRAARRSAQFAQPTHCLGSAACGQGKEREYARSAKRGARMVLDCLQCRAQHDGGAAAARHGQAVERRGGCGSAVRGGRRVGSVAWTGCEDGLGLGRGGPHAASGSVHSSTTWKEYPRGIVSWFDKPTTTKNEPQVRGQQE